VNWHHPLLHRTAAAEKRSGRQQRVIGGSHPGFYRFWRAAGPLAHSAARQRGALHYIFASWRSIRRLLPRFCSSHTASDEPFKRAFTCSRRANRAAEQFTAAPTAPVARTRRTRRLRRQREQALRNAYQRRGGISDQRYRYQRMGVVTAILAPHSTSFPPDLTPPPVRLQAFSSALALIMTTRC